LSRVILNAEDYWKDAQCALTVVALASAFYGLCSAMGYVGTLVSTSAATSKDMLFMQGWDMLCIGIAIAVCVAFVMFILWWILKFFDLVGDLTLMVCNPVFSRQNKAKDTRS
jgi:hypothetical protein